MGATDFPYPGHENYERFVINPTVWEDFDTLKHFVTRSGHGMYLRRRLEWFEKADQPTTVLWWIDEGHRPDIVEAADRLDLLRHRGPLDAAFDRRTPISSAGFELIIGESPPHDYAAEFDRFVRETKGLSPLETDPSWDDGPIEGGGTAAGIPFRALLDEFLAQREG